MKHLIFPVLFCLLMSGNAHAYLDPGTGSMILQSVLAAFVVAGSAAGIFWQRIKDTFTRSKKDETDENENQDGK